MEFFTFLEKESKALDRRLLILGALAAMINLFLLFALTAAANKTVKHGSMLWDVTIVAIGLFSYWISEGFVLRRMTVAVEAIVERVRLRIAEKIRYADLASIEMLGKAPAYNVASTHALNISRGASGIISGFTQVALLCWASLVILILSGTAFLILAEAVTLVTILFNANQARMTAWLKTSIDPSAGRLPLKASRVPLLEFGPCQIVSIREKDIQTYLTARRGMGSRFEHWYGLKLQKPDSAASFIPMRQPSPSENASETEESGKVPFLLVKRIRDCACLTGQDPDSFPA